MAPSGGQRTAGRAWRKFCANNDGGAGNNQYNKDGQLNKDLVRPLNRLRSASTVGRDEKTTITEWWDAKYTRAVFDMRFDRRWPLDPPEQHHWGPADNACWPSAIAPNDPGFVLLTNDK